jgi:hypothetical protein
MLDAEGADHSKVAGAFCCLPDWSWRPLLPTTYPGLGTREWAEALAQRAHWLGWLKAGR